MVPLQKNLRYCFLIIFVVFVWVLFFVKSYVVRDPDLGWHLQLGKYIFQHGIPPTDIFSYTMPSFPFIDHSWLSDVLLFVIYQTAGFFGLAALFATITLLIFFLILPKNILRFAWVPMILGWSVFLSRTGVRTQVVDWVFLAILYRLFADEKLWKQFGFLVPIIMFLWVNLHGGFAMGIVVLAVVIAVKSWQVKKITLRDIITFLFSIGATCINPYGVRIWDEVGMTMADPHLRTAIVEWQPFYLVQTVDFGFWMLAVLTFTFWWRYKTAIAWWKLLLVLLFFCAGIVSVRHVPLFVVVAVPLLTELLQKVRNEFTHTAVALARVKKFMGILLLLSLFVFGMQVILILRNMQVVFGKEPISANAIEVIKKTHKNGQLFSEYNWGGYLIWQFPSKRVFIDGRMPSWRFDAPEQESSWAMKEYQEVFESEEAMKRIFAKYDVTMVLLAPRRDTAFFMWLEKNKWQKIYGDNEAIIHQKIN